MLDHAWAEVEHDILYKASSKVKQLNTKRYDNLKVRMEKIMSQYIKRASVELESITREIRDLKSTKNKRP